MGLTPEQWNALSDEDKLSRAEEMPQELKGKDQHTENIQKLEKEVNDLKEQLGTAQHEKSGIYHDLKGKESVVKELKDKVAELEEKISGGGGDEDTYLTLNKANALLAKQAKELDKKVETVRGEFAQERELTDERRMKAKDAELVKQYGVSYDEAVKVFVQLCKSDPSLYRQVQSEALKPGGTPAESVYQIAITKHPEFIKRIQERGRENLISDLTKKGIVKLPAGGGGGGKPDYAKMSQEEIMNLTDAELDDLAKGKK